MPSSSSVIPVRYSIFSQWVERIRLYTALTKPRLSTFSLLTAIASYYATPVQHSIGYFIAFVWGTALCAGGAAALNQWLERDLDARMLRTQKRPLPMHQISPWGAFVFGTAFSGLGIWLLLQYVHPLAAGYAFLTVFTYVWVYTPLKTKTHWSMHVGAIPGALPTLIGCAAAQGEINLLGWVLFAWLFIWQIPHFMAIVWIYREDYAEANMPMFSVVDPLGKKAGRQAAGYSVLLLLVSLLPVYFGFAGILYASVASFMGVWLVYRAFKFATARAKDRAARHLFFTSILYLVPVLSALVLDRHF